jgi:hypothetical protein
MPPFCVIIIFFFPSSFLSLHRDSLFYFFFSLHSHSFLLKSITTHYLGSSFTSLTANQMAGTSISGRSYSTNSSEDDRQTFESVEPMQSKFHPARRGQVALGLVKPSATKAGWLNNHIPASFGFSKQWKKRFFVLVDSMLFIYKDDNSTLTWRNFMELSKDTIVFVTNEFGNKLYCIEIRKPGQERSWYVQADGPEDMKLWLNELKATVRWIKTGKRRSEDDDTMSTMSDSLSSLDISLTRQNSISKASLVSQAPPPPPDYTSRPPPPAPSDPLPSPRLHSIPRQPQQPRYMAIPPPLPPPTGTLPPTPTSRSPPVSRSGSMRLVPPPTPPPFTSLPAIPSNTPDVKSPTRVFRS